MKRVILLFWIICLQILLTCSPVLPLLSMSVLCYGHPTRDLPHWYYSVSLVLAKGESVNGWNKWWGGVVFNGPNVVKGYLFARISGESFNEVRNLFMNVFQKGQARLPTKIHNKFIALFWQLEFHCASGSDGVRIYHMYHDTLFFQSKGASGRFNGSTYL